jgi:cobalt-zinc-cadmium efflux system membrane fusion protein
MMHNRCVWLIFIVLFAVSPVLGEEKGNPSEVKLTDSQMKLITLKVEAVKQGRIANDLVLNGEVTADQDRTVEVLPRTAGIVREVKGRLGDTIRAGAPLATIESSGAAEAEAAYLGAQSKAGLTRAQAVREEGLWRKGISSQQDYQVARQAAAQADIEVRAADRKLQLLGLDPKAAGSQADGGHGPVRLTITAPFDGTLIERRVAPGDQVTESSPLFRLANLDKVWVIASVFEKDMGRVAVGQPARVFLTAYPGRQFEGGVTWISDVLDEKTRTLKIRVELDNAERLLKPGSFARVAVTPTDQRSGLVVPATAVQRQKDQTVVFVQESAGVFKVRKVKVGERSREAVSIVDGIRAEEQVVTNGAFSLLSELGKNAFVGNE